MKKRKTIFTTDPLTRHWTCACLAPLTEKQYETLVTGIKEIGQDQSGIVWPDPDGQLLIIDGYHRHKVCQEMGIAFRAKVEPADSAEKHLLDVVLQNQFVGRDNGATTSRAACEGIHIIQQAKKHGIKMRQVDFYKNYKGVASKNSMWRAKKLYELNPDWFEIIRTGHKVKVTNDAGQEYGTDSLDSLIKKHAEIEQKREALMKQEQGSNSTDTEGTIDPLYQEAEEVIRKHLKMAVMTGMNKQINMPPTCIKNLLLDAIQDQEGNSSGIS